MGKVGCEMTTLQPAGEAIEAAQVVVDRVALLAAENERLKANDARYRWLRDKLPWTLISADGVTRFFATFPLQIEASTDDSNELDAAIDVAITKVPTP